ESYFTYESEEEKNIKTGDNTTSSEILKCEFESYSEHETSIATTMGSESRIEISSNNDTLNSLEQAPKCTHQQQSLQQSSKLQKNQLHNVQNNHIQEDQLDMMQENHIQENQSFIMQEHYIQENRLHNIRDDSIITQNCSEIRKLFETITSNIILQIPPTEKPITLNLNLTFGK
ncbi:26124_t:CDS:2, partial [Racocetra persica]